MKRLGIVWSLAAIAGLVALAVYAHFVAAPAIALGVRILVIAVSVGAACWIAVSVIAQVAAAYWQTTEARESALTRRAERMKAEREATQPVIITAAHNQAVFVGEQDYALHWKPLHLTPQLRHNGTTEPIESLELGLWDRWHSKDAPPLLAESGDAAAPAALLPRRVMLADYVTMPSIRRLFLGLGKWPDGEVRPVSAPLDRLVHIATAGSSGFGKSTFMQALAWQVVNARESVAPVFLDAQGVTFTPFDGAEGLLYPLASDEADIARILAEMVGEMDRRRELYSQHRGIAKLEQYNAVAAAPLPSIPIFFDEFGLLIDNKEIAAHVRKLVQGGRKFGLSLIMGAQTWLASDISTAIRSNLSTSVQFAARDKAQSRVLLSSPAAAELTEPGQAFAILPGQSGLIELQAPDPAELVNAAPLPVGAGPRRPLEPMQPPAIVVEARAQEAQEAQEDAYFVELVEQGISRRKAAQEAYGKPYSGSTVDRGKRALGEI